MHNDALLDCVDNSVSYSQYYVNTASMYNLTSGDNTGTLKMRDMKLRDMKMRHQTARVENARHENAAPECRGGKCET